MDHNDDDENRHGGSRMTKDKSLKYICINNTDKNTYQLEVLLK